MAESRELELSAAQRGMVLGHLLDASGYAYNVGQYEAIEGPLDVELFVEAARYVVAHTQAFRTRIVLTEEGYVQQIEPDDSYCLPVIDLSGSVDPEGDAQALLQRLVSTPFDLSVVPLCRWALVKLAKDRWHYVGIFHHAVIDGLSGLLWVQRTAQVYTALSTGEPLPVYEAGEVATLVGQETAYRASSQQERDRQYWLQRLAGCEPSPAWSGRLLGKSRNAVRQTLVLPAALTAQLRVQARRLETTVGQLVTAASALLQCLHGRSNSCVLGLPVLGRRGRPVRLIPGMTSNVAHLRLDCGPQLTVMELVAAVGRQFDAALRHQRYDSVQLRRDLGLKPEDPDLYSLSVNLMPFDHALRFADSPSQNHNLANGPEQGLGLMVYDEPGQSELRLDLNGNTDLYTAEDLARYLTQLQQVLEQLGSASADAPLARLDLVGPPQSGRLAAFNATDHALDSSLLLPDLFAAQVIKTPEAIALVLEDQELTYAELDARSSQLARHLITLGAGPEVRVAIGLERSVELIVAILATLKSGAAYVPLDPEYPIDRLSYMLTDSAASLVITTRDLAERLTSGAHAAGAEQVLLDDPAVLDALDLLSAAPVTDGDRPAALHPQNLAYLIYTSGSTGRPKGVGNTHAGVINLIAAQSAGFDLQAGDRLLQFASQAFDSSVAELADSLSQGAALVLMSEQTRRDTDLLVQVISRQSVMHAFLPSGILSGLSRDQLSGLRTLVVAGEACPAELVTRFSPGRRMINAYGPTETTVCATMTQALDAERDLLGSGVPIGAPIWNTQIHVLDLSLRPVPIGVWGEL
ncbi:MAG: AMP-binding protein, partial [Proteobacteria bacterium]|nr:AMP-binding protein [Pseudomonadota bacterium]